MGIIHGIMPILLCKKVISNSSRCESLGGIHMANSCICFQCDNETLVYNLNKQGSKESQIMLMIRKFVLLALQYNISFKAEHIPRKKFI